MYSRYIPTPNGYVRQTVPENREMPKRQEASPSRPTVRPPAPDRSAAYTRKQGFRLIPAGFDTGDLLVAALLLLMAGDCPENRSTFLLTLAMYFLL